MASEIDVADSGSTNEPKETEEISSLEDLIAKHRKERKDLQAQVQKLKHSIPKGDKKKKKEVTEQIAKLEAELDARHEQEQTSFEQKNKTQESNTVTASGEPVVETVAEQPTAVATGKKSKAQRRREKKQDVEAEREDRIKAQEVENRQGPRHKETLKIKEMLKTRGLLLYEIPADGNCMYSAVSHQLASQGIQHSNSELRQQTADYMRAHRDDFLPFLTHPDTGDMLTEEEFEKYCEKTSSTPVWGGQVELRALSEVLRVPIEILQAELDPLVVGEDIKEKTPLTLVYHRHMYRMGEHYNSVVNAPANCEDES